MAYEQLYCRDLEANRDVNKLTTLTPTATPELQWWVLDIHKDYKYSSLPPPPIVITTDASMTGWGAVWNGTSIGGHWSESEGNHHINYL